MRIGVIRNRKGRRRHTRRIFALERALKLIRIQIPIPHIDIDCSGRIQGFVSYSQKTQFVSIELSDK